MIDEQRVKVYDLEGWSSHPGSSLQLQHGILTFLCVEGGTQILLHNTAAARNQIADQYGADFGYSKYIYTALTSATVSIYIQY